MSIKGLLMPAITQRLLSRARLLEQRASAERARIYRGERHQVHYFHQVDDPYSALAATSLPRWVSRYDVDLVPHVVGPTADAAAPERDRLVAYSRKDAQLLARHSGLDFRDTGAQPATQAVDRASGLLVAATEDGHFVEAAGPVSARLWKDPESLQTVARSGAPLRVASAAAVAAHLSASSALRQRLGHYLGATFFYGGEWYWGIDRLHHLERRLQALGAARPGVHGPMFAPSRRIEAPVKLRRAGDSTSGLLCTTAQVLRSGLSPYLLEPVQLTAAVPIDFFFSLRSPYSAIVAKRVFELGRLTGAPVRLRFVLPMVMRGLPVPVAKRTYIGLDAAREAFVRGIPFGRLNDPLGRPTERGLALIPFAERAGKGQDYLLSFMRGVWAEGIDAGSDRGLRRIVERAGLPWGEARIALQDEAWRTTAEENRVELFGLGLWGVPSFRVRDTAVWGQDRLGAIQRALLELNTHVVTVATRLPDSGYRTYVAGKWHVGKEPHNLPPARGFDRSIVMGDSGSDNWETGKRYLDLTDKVDWFEDGKLVGLGQSYFRLEAELKPVAE